MFFNTFIINLLVDPIEVRKIHVELVFTSHIGRRFILSLPPMPDTTRIGVDPRYPRYIPSNYHIPGIPSPAHHLFGKTTNKPVENA